MQTKISSNSLSVIKNSAPLITANAHNITKKMYEILFIKYPDVKKLFLNAPDNQSSLVAEAISAYATNIENISVLLPALQVIADTHTTVKVQPHHYLLLGRIFIEALEIVLKELATLEFLDAWREAYKYIVNILINLEKKIYQKG